MRPRTRIGDGHRPDILRCAAWRILGEEHLTIDAFRKPLQRDRAVAVRGDERLADIDDVPGEIELGDARLGPEHAGRAGNPNLSHAVQSVYLEHLRFAGHTETVLRTSPEWLNSGTRWPSRLPSKRHHH